MLRVILMLLMISFAVEANENCEWNQETPCLTIAKGKLANSNQLGDRITSTSIITKSDMERRRLQFGFRSSF